MAEQINATSIGLGLSLGTGLGVVLGSMIDALNDSVGFWTAWGIPLGSGIGLILGILISHVWQPDSSGCSNCGYSTVGLQSDTCPECGNDPQ